MRRRRRPALLAVPALIVTVPLTGFALQNEERRTAVRSAREFGSNPLEVVRFAIDTTGLFLRAGNFRPLGRLVEKAELAFAFETAEATGLSVHSVQGVLRLALVAAIAVTAGQVVAAVLGSASAGPSRPLLMLYSLTFGATLVANHHLSPLPAFPVLFLGSPLLVLAVVLAVARDVDMQLRQLAWFEYLTMVLLGAATAMFFDIVYAAPVLAGAFVVTRAVAAGRPIRQMWGLAASRRWVALSAGFLAVFVPTRISIAVLCARYKCNSASEVVLSVDVLRVWGERALSGLPPAGWAYGAERVAPYEYRDGLAAVTGNWLVVLLLAAVLMIGAHAARLLLRTPSGPSVGSPAECDAELEAGCDGESSGRRQASFRAAAALAAFGALMVAVLSLMASLSRGVHNWMFGIGRGWRETLLVQFGWSLVALAGLLCILALARRRAKLRAMVTAATVAVLCTGIAATLVNNYRFGQVGRGTPTTMLVRQMSTTAVRADLTAAGNARRCGIMDAYEDLYPDGEFWGGPQVREELNHLMLDRYGTLFCDGPGTEKELTGDPPEAWEWRVQPR